MYVSMYVSTWVGRQAGRRAGGQEGRLAGASGTFGGQSMQRPFNTTIGNTAARAVDMMPLPTSFTNLVIMFILRRINLRTRAKEEH